MEWDEANVEFGTVIETMDRLCGLVVRVPGC
jgi:hypothetical protein